ncbi:SDR family NAD(P)-dependent oxidoreductase [Labrenzia sp. PHM005]|uniref:SDR family NAD(P)-dependent oxidoreductase n=1 Tax=Labrenzia sp. PHM005 TaxID=2590016 RepID=UPI00114049FD|nr:SDR family NAD(P)-dependent oxidoreductase [Labrenzia sp. PHM005]QDG75024.1 trans- AT polyketide synthase type I [Labrenzia sp. PHM005]
MALLLNAAGRGLFPAAGVTFRPDCRAEDLEASLEPADFNIRPAAVDDIDTLHMLETVCWPKELQTPTKTLASRVAIDPNGQLVLTLDGSPCGVIYSQRINSVEALTSSDMDKVDSLRDPSGSILHFLAINILPSVQDRGLGDALLEFILHYAALAPGIKSAAAVTLCRDFTGRTLSDLNEYLRRKTPLGTVADPVLRFHELHGGRIQHPVPNYRARDTRNLGAGVLVTYDLNKRRRSHAPQPRQKIARTDIANRVNSAIRSALGSSSDQFEKDTPLISMGLDSAAILGLADCLQAECGSTLTAAQLFKHNTAEKIIAFLHNELPSSGLSKPTLLPAQTSCPADGGSDQSVAIIGVSLRMPGGIETPQALWELLDLGGTVITPVPSDRWSWPDGFRPQGAAYGGFLQDPARFDAAFFRISPHEAEAMDPQQRILLELAWHGLEDAGLSATKLAGSSTGVFVGASGSDYQRAMDAAGVPVQPHHSTGAALSVIANRLSYALDFTGPSLVVDTACSSSLVAVHQAVAALQERTCGLALAAGINLILHPATSQAYQSAGMLSPSGLCRSFGSGADGYVRSEGAVLLVLKPLAQALAEGCRVHAVIRGSACNHGGMTSGLTVPSPDKQTELLSAAWHNADIKPADLDYLEAHGTGTKLGDPIEIEGMKTALAEFDDSQPNPPEQHACLTGSVKSNLGHLEAAAGLAGLCKVMLALRHERLPASLNASPQNPEISLNGSNLAIADTARDWPKGNRPRISGVSSFGSGGTNAHIVVAEPPDAPDGVIDTGPQLFVLSANTPERLMALAVHWQEWLKKQPHDLNIPALCHASRHRRAALPARFATKVSSRADLEKALHQAAQKNPASSQAKPKFLEHLKGDAGQAFLQALAKEGDLSALADLWCAGVPVDWSLIDSTPPEQPVPWIDLPLYPFDKTRFWALGKAPAVPQDRAAATAELYAPVWQELAASKTQMPEPDLLSGPFALKAAQLLKLDPSESRNSETNAIGENMHVLWSSAPRPSDSGETLEEFREFQDFVAGLPRQLSRLRLTVVTWNGQAVYGNEPVDAEAAAISAFTHVLAQEKPEWDIRTFDLDSCDPPSWSSLAESNETRSAVRAGKAYGLRLAMADPLPDTGQSHLREDGVYVVIGGAGGIGTTWSEAVLNNVQAQVIWIGRRPHNAAITAHIDRLTRLGPPPIYIQADATNPDALERALQEILKRWGRIDGVIHAITGPSDQPILDSEPENLTRVMAAKTHGLIQTAHTFAALDLDFFLVFSSIISLEQPGGFGGYAASCAFADAFVRGLDSQTPYPVRCLNWGHWDVGVARNLPEATKIRLDNAGVVPITAQDALKHCDTALNAPLPQLAILKWNDPARHPLVDSQVHMRLSRKAPARSLPAATNELNTRLQEIERHGLFAHPELEAALPGAIAAELDRHGLRTSLPDTAPWYLRRWHKATKRLLAQGNTGENWDATARRLRADADLAPAINLVTACLARLHEVLTGQTPATDVLFPGASLDLLEPVYRGTASADLLNDVLADTLAETLRADLRDQPENTSLRVLEIGAGTGGTTARVLPCLSELAGQIETYDYTDLSRAFLQHAQQAFAPSAPFLKSLRFDVEKSPESQGLQPGSYDAVLATNVLHATPDIRQTLRHTHALLKPGGVLLLNEIVTPSVFAHATFGLLEGWWKSCDPGLRHPDTPLLSAESWEKLLLANGFTAVEMLLNSSTALGQQVFAARSDGCFEYRKAEIDTTRRQPETLEPRILKNTVSELPLEDLENPQAAAARLLTEIVASALQITEDQLDPWTPLGDYGLDSILNAQVTARLRELVPDLDTTFLYQYQTIADLSQALVQKHPEAFEQIGHTTCGEADVASPSTVSASKRTAGNEQQDIAIVGMSFRFPKADTPEEFWTLLSQGQSAVTEIPPDRWQLDGFYESDPDKAVDGWKSYSKWGAFLERVTAFDPLFFGINPKEAAAIDPQERLFLQTAWAALEDAGFPRQRLADELARSVGVFVGITRTGFDLFGPDLWQAGQKVYPHTSFSSAANRLSWFLDADGPSMPVDTMCSSSLTALHQACASLKTGECRLAIAGGVNLFLHPTSYIGLSAMRMLSPDGRCSSFGAGGNGFVPGEGVAALVLRPLAEAQAAGDQVIGVIRGSAVNHGGRTNGFTVPNPRAQSSLVREAMSRAGLEPGQISYLEAHGTGTEMGDPIEITGLTEAFAGREQGLAPCAIGSIKTNIGHLEATAGLAGVIKVLLQMRHRQIVPSLHSSSLNPKIDFEHAPFRVAQDLTPWSPAKGRRIAGVSSFGAGGTNAHVILEEAPDIPEKSATDPAPNEPIALVLSAHDEPRLRAYAARLAKFLTSPNAPPLALAAQSLQLGREPMRHRMAAVVSDKAQAVAVLQAVAENRPLPDKTFLRDTRRYKGQCPSSVESEDLGELTDAWSKGSKIDWAKLHQRRQTVSLPTYPFDEKPYWFADTAPVGGPMDVPSSEDAFRELKPASRPSPVRRTLPRLDTAPAQFEPHRRSQKLRLSSLNPASETPPAEIELDINGIGRVRLEPASPPPNLSTGNAMKVLVVEGLQHWNGDRLGLLHELDQLSQPVILTVSASSLPPIPDTLLTAPAFEQAQEMANATARCPAATLATLKNHIRNQPSWPDIAGIPAEWMAGSGWPVSSPEPAPSGGAIPLQSEVVQLHDMGGGVAQITMAERDAQNTFTPAFVTGVLEAFDKVESSAAFKVVVLTGYEAYFACGGTREGLLAIQNGQARFTDEQSYARPLRCPIPVIAAMQGHGIGAGWAMGLYCDLAIYSEESCYQSPYMLYGFTPGAGATTLFPARLGRQLANEILFTAQSFPGHILAQKGLTAPVLPREEVLPQAHALARSIAQNPRETLMARKSTQTAEFLHMLPRLFEAELALHESTFVGNSDVLEQISEHFADKQMTQKPGASQKEARNTSALKTQLRMMLAEELDIPPDRIDDDTPFVDLGLESIAAVIWVRKIGEELGAQIGATSVYSHPNLAAFTELVAEKGGQLAEAVNKTTAPPSEPPKAAIPADPEERLLPSDSSDLFVWLQASLETELSIPSGTLDPDRPFVELGLDSVTAVTWIRQVNDALGTKETGTVVYHHTNLTELAAYLAGIAGKTPTTRTTSLPYKLEAPVRSALPRLENLAPFQDERPGIAIVGMAGRFPEAPNVSSFWQNVLAGRDCVYEIPATRWSIDAYYDPDRQAPGKTVCRRMGAIEDIDAFDSLFFGISPAEAELMDPQQRLFLETAWEAIEDAGHAPSTLAGTRCGLFVGTENGDYARIAGDAKPEALALTGRSVAMLPARAAYALDLQGPCLAIDTACSASLVAIAQACASLHDRHCDSALAGGVNVLTGPEIHVAMSHAGMLSPSGKCNSFDSRADGFVPGEGVGALLLKRLEDAQANGDDVYAVIRGWGVNQDGRTNGITAPNPAAQTRLQTELYHRFHIDPARIGMVEAHGTGTALGDPIEVEALKRSFAQFTDRKNYCALGSVKSNIGHLATAAGVAGAIKATLALKHRKIPASIHHDQLNPHIDLKDAPFYVPRTAADWTAGPDAPQYAAVSSFGYSGTNAHLVLEAAPARPVPVTQTQAVIVPVSARSLECLTEAVTRLSTYLGTGAGQTVPLADLALTYQTGRDTFDQRVAFLADSHDSLRAGLEQFLNEPEHAGGVVYSNDMPPTLRDTATAWIEGKTIAWPVVAGASRRHGCPTYPFAKERHWVSDAPVELPEAAPIPSKETPLQPEAEDTAVDPDWRERLKQRFARPITLLSDDPKWIGSMASLLSALGAAPGGPGQPDLRIKSNLREAEGSVFCDTHLGTRLPGNEQVDLLILTELPSDPGLIPQHALIVSDDNRDDIESHCQRLIQEWLRLEPDGSKDTLHVQFRNGRRLVAAKPLDPADGACILRKTWQRTPLADQKTAPSDKNVCLIGRGPKFEALASGLEAHFQSVTLRDTPPEGAMAAWDVFIDAAALTEVRDNDPDDPDRRHWIQSLMREGRDLNLLHLTCDVIPFRSVSRNLAGARQAGLVKNLRAEYRFAESRWLDLDMAQVADTAGLAKLIAAECASAGPVSEVCYRGGARFAPVLEAPEPVASPSVHLNAEGLYLISGGTRGVGLTLAQDLAAQGARHLALIGETPLPPMQDWPSLIAAADTPAEIRSQLSILQALSDQLETLEILHACVSDAAKVSAWLSSLRKRGLPLSGVIHAAGRYSEVDPPGFAAKSADHMRAVLTAKADGLETLHSLTKNDPLSFLLVLTSITGLVPHFARGALDYAMANAYADLFAAKAHELDGGRTRSTILSDWTQSGAFCRVRPEKAKSVQKNFDQIGLKTLSDAEGCALIRRALSPTAETGTILGLIAEDRFAAARPGLLLAGTLNDEALDMNTQLARWEKIRSRGDLVTIEDVTSVIGLEQIRELPPAQMLRLHRIMLGPTEVVPPEAEDESLPDMIAGIVCNVLKLKEIDHNTPLQNYGLDSISGMILSTRLEIALDMTVDPRTLIDHPSIAALSAYIQKAREAA